MAQLRRDHHEFARRDAEILVVGPEDAAAFRKYWADHDLPFIGLPDPEHRVLNLYGQQVKLLKFGRMPAQVLVDKDGTLRFVHYADSMSDIPPNDELIGLLDSL
jgi:peroxiredoxin Q/BCP